MVKGSKGLISPPIVRLTRLYCILTLNLIYYIIIPAFCSQMKKKSRNSLTRWFANSAVILDHLVNFWHTFCQPIFSTTFSRSVFLVDKKIVFSIIKLEVHKEPCLGDSRTWNIGFSKKRNLLLTHDVVGWYCFSHHTCTFTRSPKIRFTKKNNSRLFWSPITELSNQNRWICSSTMRTSLSSQSSSLHVP